MGKQLVWGVAVVDALAHSRLNQGSLCNRGTTVTEAEALEIEKYRELINNGYIFQPVALEVQGSLGEGSEIFITRLCKMFCHSHDDQRAGTFLKQQIAMTLPDRQCSLCCRNCERERCLRINILHVAYFLQWAETCRKNGIENQS